MDMTMMKMAMPIMYMHIPSYIMKQIIFINRVQEK